LRKVLSALLLLLALGACATTQAGPNGLADRDPREGFNRTMFEVNDTVDSVTLRPISQVYRAIAPQPARRGLSNVLRNLTEPWSFVNNLLQGKPGRALRNLGRFIVNTTIGVGGLADHATDLGIAPAPEDFGQTLAVWGVGDGGYSYTPLLGPSTSRDTFGTIVGFFANPVTIFFDRGLGLSTQEQLGILAAGFVNARAELTESGFDAFLDSSADPYAAVRSAYFQQREAAILDQDSSGLTTEHGVNAAEAAAFEAAIEELPEDDAGDEIPPDPDIADESPENPTEPE